MMMRRIGLGACLGLVWVVGCTSSVEFSGFTGVSASKKLSDLTPSEEKSVCEQELTAISDPDILCTLNGIAATLLGGDCESARDTCLKNPPPTSDITSGCASLPAFPSTCAITVDQLASCTNGLLDIFKGLSCSSSLGDLETMALPSDCTAIQTECPGIVQMPGSAPSGG